MTAIPVRYMSDLMFVASPEQSGTDDAALRKTRPQKAENRSESPSIEAGSSDTSGTIPYAHWIADALPSLQRLTSLPPNWDSYGSPAPTAELLAEVLRHLRGVGLPELEPPQVVPATEGGIQLEWISAGRELEVEFPPVGDLEYLATDTASGEPSEGRIERGDHFALRSLLKQVFVEPAWAKRYLV